MNCAIWGKDAWSNTTPPTFQSDRAGGEYTVDPGELVSTISRLKLKQKVLLTTWLVNQRRSGENTPTITPDVINKTLPNMRSLPYITRFGRFFEFLTTRGRLLGISIPIKSTKDPKKGLEFLEKAAAWCECTDDNELWEIIRILDLDAYIKLGAADEFIRVTSKGFGRIDQVSGRVGPSYRGFVAMWFHKTMHPARDEILSAIEDAGYEPRHLELTNYVDTITDEIISEIRGSRFIVADFTCPQSADSSEGNVRGSVYYEAGFAKALGLPVFCCCRENCEGFLHFDIAQFPHLLWKDETDLRKRLSEKIVAVLGRGPRPPGQGDAAIGL